MAWSTDARECNAQFAATSIDADKSVQVARPSGNRLGRRHASSSETNSWWLPQQLRGVGLGKPQRQFRKGIGRQSVKGVGKVTAPPVRLEQ